MGALQVVRATSNHMPDLLHSLLTACYRSLARYVPSILLENCQSTFSSCGPCFFFFFLFFLFLFFSCVFTYSRKHNITVSTSGSMGENHMAHILQHISRSSACFLVSQLLNEFGTCISLITIHSVTERHCTNITTKCFFCCCALGYLRLTLIRCFNLTALS